MRLPVKGWAVQSRGGRRGASLAGVAVTGGPKRRQRVDGGWNWLPKSACCGGRAGARTSESSTSGLAMRETGCSAGGLDYVTTKRPIPEPMRPISVHRLVSDGGDERGTTTVRRIANGSRTAPYYR